MKQLLKLLIEKYFFLFEEIGFRFVDSDMDESFGGSAYIILAKDELDICFLKSRDGLELEFGNNAKRTPGRKWFSLDIVKQYLTKEDNPDINLDEKNAAFLKEYILEIIGLFSIPAYKGAKGELHSLEKARAKKIFG